MYSILSVPINEQLLHLSPLFRITSFHFLRYYFNKIRIPSPYLV